MTETAATAAYADLVATLDAAWEDRASVTQETKGKVRDAVEAALDLLDGGKARVAEKIGDEWVVNQWLKKAVLLSFRLTPTALIQALRVVLPGGTRCPRSSKAWTRPLTRLPASAPCRAPSSVARPISPPALC